MIEVHQYLDIKKEIQRHLLQFLNDEICDDDNYAKLIQYFQDPIYQKYWNNMKEKLYFISTILNNYKPTSYLPSKIEKVFILIQDEMKQKLTNIEIFQFFKNNKMILLYLIKNKIINPDQSIIKTYAKEKGIFDYFFPEFKEFFEINQYKKYKGIINHLTKLQIEDPTDYQIFLEKRKSGQNDFYICQLIQNDSIEEFVSYTNKNNISLSSRINSSFFETNQFLLKHQKTTTLIEYAAFYGSIQIFKYLDLNNVEMPSSLWMYTIHSRSSELIHYLEERSIPIPKDSFNKEILKLHDFDLTDYFIDNQIVQMTDNDLSFSIKYCNYSYYPQNLGNWVAYYYCCKYNYNDLIDIINKSGYKFEVDFYYKFNSLTQITIPSFITSIKRKAFKGYKKLKEISIPSSVTSIGESAFENCSSLDAISIPSSVTSISCYAFSNCTFLTNISIPSSVTVIKSMTFYNCYLLKEISLPSSITSIENSSFYNCFNLRNISIPSSCKYVGNDAFLHCKSLKKVVIPSQLKVLGKKCFAYCYSLELVSFEIPFSLEVIEDFCFVGCISLKEMWIPYSVKRINNSSFQSCPLLNVHIPNSLASIGEGAFAGCKSCSRF